MEDLKRRRIVIHYIPSLNIPPETFETTGRAGYHIHSDENGPIGYRIYIESQTILVPMSHVQRITLDL